MKFSLNDKAEYNSKPIQPLDNNFKIDHVINMHCFWRGVFGEKQFGSIKSLFTTQKTYNYNLTLWWNDKLDISDDIKFEFDAFKHKYKNCFSTKEFNIEDQIDYNDKRLVNLRTICINDFNNPVAFSDDVRVICLYKYGGLYFDLDCLFLRDMKNMYSYHNFSSAWGDSGKGNTAIFYIENPKNTTICQIVDQAVECKSCHPYIITHRNIKYDNFYVCPCWCFDPIWDNTIKNIPFLPPKSNCNIFQANNKIIPFNSTDIGIFPCSYVWHWHNKWNYQIDDNSIFRQAMYFYGGIVTDNSLNIICNNCIGSFAYNYFKQQFANPFIGNVIDIDDFAYLVHNYDSIDFKKAIFEIVDRIVDGKIIDNQKYVKCIIDERMCIHYVHYRYLKNRILSKDYTNVYSENIIEYVKNKYYSRIERMLSNQIDPTFILYDSSYMHYDLNKIIMLLNEKTKYKVFYVAIDQNRYNAVLSKVEDKSKVIFYHQTKWLEYCVPLLHRHKVFDYDKKYNIVLESKKQLNAIPKIIWQFWTGDNELTPNRIDCIKSTKNNVKGVEFRLLKGQEIYDMQVPGHPFHPAYQYLSIVHKSDYLRSYFMHYYGGGYADIKEYSPNNNWSEMFDKLNYDENIWGIGQQEIKNGAAYPWMRNSIITNKLIAMGYFMFKPNTIFTKEWLDAVNKILDENFDKLKACWDKQKDMPFPQTCQEYPISWSGILGIPMHELNYKYKDTGRILNCLITGRTSKNIGE